MQNEVLKGGWYHAGNALKFGLIDEIPTVEELIDEKFSKHWLYETKIDDERERLPKLLRNS